jgi:hypothetical protein
MARAISAAEALLILMAEALPWVPSGETNSHRYEFVSPARRFWVDVGSAGSVQKCGSSRIMADPSVWNFGSK